MPAYRERASDSSPSSDILSSLDPRQCTICKKKFKSANGLDRHMDIHDPNKDKLMHICPAYDCGYKSLQKSNIRIHVEAKHMNIRHPCVLVFNDGELCTKNYSDAAALIRHEKTVHKFYRKSAKEAIKRAVAQFRAAKTSTALETPSEGAPSRTETACDADGAIEMGNSEEEYVLESSEFDSEHETDAGAPHTPEGLMSVLPQAEVKDEDAIWGRQPWGADGIVRCYALID
ncbi:hypothetical protein DFH11DRAFT_1223749 [Phellopilus nigrolimitatus]|nr:hypothetical protein DFH11DRAFT_1223749 [Phellopilus nigrolimitatus]